jgi:primase-polymerase (primpol)-like protein
MIAEAPERPAALPVRAEEIPAELRERRQWVCWHFRRPAGKWTKVPVDPKTGRNASTTDPATWAAFDEALAYHQGHPEATDGIGYVFSQDDPYVGVDIDNCRDPDAGTLDEWGDDAINKLGTYSEISPTGTGVKCIMRGRCPGERHKGSWQTGDVEVYDSGRFFALTGHRLDWAQAEILEQQAGLDHLYSQVFAAEQPHQANGTAPTHAGAALSDEEVIDRARRAANGDKFDRLWAGDTNGHGGDASAADLALCSHLRFWTGADRAQADRLFRRSGLMRPKWNVRHSGDGRTYGQMTLDKAMVGEVYTPRHPGATAGANGLPGSSEGAGGPPPEPHLTDAGNAIRLVHRHGDDLRHCHPWRKWMAWDGARWREDDTGDVPRRAKQTIRALFDKVLARMMEISRTIKELEAKGA